VVICMFKFNVKLCFMEESMKVESQSLVLSLSSHLSSQVRTWESLLYSLFTLKVAQSQGEPDELAADSFGTRYIQCVK
jgi:hypothetical protein